MILLEIVLTFMKIGALCFGGGYASIALVEREIVVGKAWMTYAEFADLMAIDEITPGPIIVNAATFVGTKVAGLPGAITATLGSIIFPCIISFLLIVIYRKYKNVGIVSDILFVLKSMALALILSTLISIFINVVFTSGQYIISDIDYFLLILMIISFILIRKFKIYPIIVMLGCGLLNILMSFIR